MAQKETDRLGQAINEYKLFQEQQHLKKADLFMREKLALKHVINSIWCLDVPANQGEGIQYIVSTNQNNYRFGSPWLDLRLG